MTAVVALWFSAMAMAMLLDRPIALWLSDTPLPAWLKAHQRVAEVIKAPGEWYFTVAAALIAAYAHPLRWRAGVVVVLAMAVSGMNGLFKWIVGRTRPFKLAMYDDAGAPLALPFQLEPFRGGIVGIAYGSNLCFPSGHAALSFATATALAILWPRARWRWLLYAGAIIASAERIAENAHWLSDIIAGAGLGTGGVYLINAVVTRLMNSADVVPVPPQRKPLTHE